MANLGIGHMKFFTKSRYVDNYENKSRQQLENSQHHMHLNHS